LLKQERQEELGIAIRTDRYNKRELNEGGKEEVTLKEDSRKGMKIEEKFFFFFR
jgi:hypothetical protein